MTGHIDVVFIQCVGNGGIYFTGHCQLDSFLYILESSFTAHGHAFFVCCVKNVCLQANLVEKRNFPGEYSLYADVMYVEQDADADPYAERYAQYAEPAPEVPF